ncbi:hypothetical protein AAHH76_14660 [Bacillus toyonensis]
MRKLKRVNVPNIPEQLSQPSDNRTINKKKLRRLILMVLFIAADYFVCSIYFNETARDNNE